VNDGLTAVADVFIDVVVATDADVDEVVVASTDGSRA
jgi:hypothetical protein